MDLKDFILTYKVNDEVVANLFDYYDIYIKGLDKRFEPYSYHSTNLVLCFFKDHADINPSMGYINDKQHKGGKLCHCFGCGRTADVIRIHQILRSSYEGVELTEKEACIEVAELFKIPIDEFDELSDEDYEEKYLRNLRKIDRLSKHYTVRDFSAELLKLRTNYGVGEVDLDKLNSSCVRMIATSKHLYD